MKLKENPGWVRWTDRKPEEFQVCDFWWPLDEGETSHSGFDWILCGSTPAPAVGWEGKGGQFPSEYWGVFGPPIDGLWWRPSAGLPNEEGGSAVEAELSADDYKRMYEECLKELDEERGSSFRLARLTEEILYAIDGGSAEDTEGRILSAISTYGDPDAEVDDDDYVGGYL